MMFKTSRASTPLVLHETTKIPSFDSLPNTMDEATPMKPKKAAEEGHVSKLKVLMVAVVGCVEEVDNRRLEVPRCV